MKNINTQYACKLSSSSGRTPKDFEPHIEVSSSSSTQTFWSRLDFQFPQLRILLLMTQITDMNGWNQIRPLVILIASREDSKHRQMSCCVLGELWRNNLSPSRIYNSSFVQHLALSNIWAKFLSSFKIIALCVLSHVNTFCSGGRVKNILWYKIVKLQLLSALQSFSNFTDSHNLNTTKEPDTFSGVCREHGQYKIWMSYPWRPAQVSEKQMPCWLSFLCRQ